MENKKISQSLKKFYQTEKGKEKRKQLSLNRKAMGNPIFKPGAIEKLRETIKGHYEKGIKMGFQCIKSSAFRLQYSCSKCEECGKVVDKMVVHHIDSNQSNHLITNLECLCRSCHIRRHYQPYMLLEKRFKFDSAHHLKGMGKCSRVHGHTYELRIVIGNRLKRPGIVEDFGKVGEIVKESILDKLDHFDLNKRFDFPSAELMIRWIFETLNHKLKGLKEVELWEQRNESGIKITDESYTKLLGE